MEQNNRQKLGNQGETVACDYLCSQGLTLLEKNWRDGKNGELDLVMLQDNEVVFVEVKTRRNHPLLAIGETVDAKKLHRLQKLGRSWLRSNGSYQAHRIDMVGVVYNNDSPRIFWWKAIER